MKSSSTGPLLSTVFVDYDNIYLSLKRKNDDAAKRFAKDAQLWLKEIETGRLISATNSPSTDISRRIVMNRCYGNPVPRRNGQDNATDMNSFPFVRHHFLRAGCEVIDCPPLTQQLKNSADIRMVMDIRDLLTHDTYFDEFIILSGDADFTPVLQRLRAHARRTVIFANEHTAAPYTAISDGEVREADLMTFLLDGRVAPPAEAAALAQPAGRGPAQIETTRRQIIAEVAAAVRQAGQPLPLEALADRAVRALGHERTVASSWGGAGSFRDLLVKDLPEPLRLSEQAPYVVYDASQRQAGLEAPGATAAYFDRSPEGAASAIDASPTASRAIASQRSAAASDMQQPLSRSAGSTAAPPPAQASSSATSRAALNQQPASAAGDGAAALQQSIARIHDACQAPPLSPPEYRALFEVISQEIGAKGLNGAQTVVNVCQRALAAGHDFRRDDVRFILDVVSEADPWFEQGASANLFAGRFRNFVVARCRGQGLVLSADELDLIDAWFAGPSAPPRRLGGGSSGGNGPMSPLGGGGSRAPVVPASASVREAVAVKSPEPAASDVTTERWWTIDETTTSSVSRQPGSPFNSEGEANEEFPRIVRSRLRG